MDTKRVAFAGIVLVALSAGLVLVRNRPATVGRRAGVTPTAAATDPRPDVTVTIDDGKTAATYSAVRADTPYAALESVSATHKIPVKTKRYDFGIFVSEIAGLPSGTDMAWIVSVNGKSLTAAADTVKLSSGDSVEWSYKKPTW